MPALRRRPVGYGRQRPRSESSVYYSWYEWQRASLAPWLTLARRRTAPWLRPGVELAARNAAAGEPAKDDLATYLRREHGAPVRARTLAATPFYRLRAFRAEGGPGAPRVLLVAPWSGYAAGALAEFVAALLPEAEVLVTDWVDARLVPPAAGPFDLDAQVLAVLDAVRAHGPALHVVAVSQGVVPALAATALAAAEGVGPRSLALLGGPVDARRNPTAGGWYLASTPMSLLTAQLLSVVPTRFPGRGRLVYPGALQLLTYATTNAGLYVNAQAGLLAELAAGEPDGFARLHAELHGLADVPGELVVQGVRVVYRDAALPRGAWSVGGRPVEPVRIERTALLTVEAGRDELVGPEQTHAAQELCPALLRSRRARLTLPDAGHVDLFKGPSFRTRLAPALRAFIAAHDR